MRRQLLISLALAAAALPGAAYAQSYADAPRATGFDAGIAGAVGQPVGAFADEVGTAGGLSLYGGYHMSPAVSLRLEGTFLIYGHERRSVCAAESCRVLYDLDTNNQIFSAFIGPRFEVPGGPIRPYVGGGVGLGYFFTTSSLSGTMGEQFASTNNFDDAVLSWTGGGGVKVPFSIHRVPVAFEAGARYQRNGDVSYLRRGTGITDLPDGSIQINPTIGPADFVLWHVGVNITIPHHGQGGHYRGH